MSESLPLSGTTVLDMTHVGAGPFASSLLGQLGADVIKIEGEAGDRMRNNRPKIGAGSIGYYFASVNAQKRFIQLDLKTAEGQKVLARMAARSDVFIESFRPGVVERLGASYEKLKAVNEGLVYCSIKGFRSGTEFAEDGSIDYVHQAMTGVMSMTRREGELPPLPGYPAADFAGALYAALGVVAALSNRGKTGAGDFIEVALQDSLLSLLPLRMGYTFATGEAYPPFGSHHRDFVPFGVFPTVDDPIVIAAATERLWRQFVSVVPELDRPEFATMDDRLELKSAFYEELELILERRPASDWLSELRSAGVPAGPVLDTKQVYESDYTQDSLRSLLVDGEPFSWVPYAPRHRSFSPVIEKAPSPAGAHTREVLGEMGLSSEELEELFTAGAIFGSPETER